MQPSSYITNKLIAKKIIAEDEYELYQYSINALFEMTHGDSATAYTKATNNKSTGKYISAGVTKRYADSNATINSSNKAQVVSGGGSIKASIARSWKETNREYRHIVESWNCSYQPSGSGWDQYHVDVVSYTIKQSK